MMSLLRVIVILLNILSLEQINGKPGTIQKCCPKGLQLDAEIQSCIEVPGRSVSTEKEEILYPPIDLVTNYWVHPALQSYTLLAYYLSSISDFKLEVTATNQFPKPDFEVLEFKGEINPLLILQERYCYDRTPINDSLPVLVQTVLVRKIYKCCSKGQRLNIISNECQKYLDLADASLKEEIVGLPRGQEEFSWIPKNISRYILKIRYKALKSGDNYHIRVIEKEEFSWRILPPETDRETIIWFRGQNVSGATDVFCFDETTDGNRVLLAALYDVYKCCGEDEQMNDILHVCVPRDGNIRTKDNQSSSVDSYWLPEAMSKTQLNVQHDSIFQMSLYKNSPKGFIYDESTWKVEKASDSSLPRLIVNLTELSGNPVVVNTTRFCFDYLQGSTRVVIMHVPKVEDYIRKCCFPGEIFSKRGVCERYEGATWTPGRSNARAFFKQTLTEQMMIYPLKYYCGWHFNIIPLNSSRSIRHFQGNHTEVHTRVYAEYCNEWRRTADGLEEVVGFCETPAYASFYQKVAPLGLASAILLVVSAVLASTNEEMRRSSHGFALACHALCLAAVQILQVAVFFMWPMFDNDCYIYMYFAYFFLVSAHWWLTVITFNIYSNFRQPLGAMGGRKPASNVWKRFGVLSFVAWSGSLVLTALAVVTHSFRVEMLKRGYSAPSFLETRTCAFEDLYHFIEETDIQKPLGNPQGSIFYYLIPMSLLSIANLVCVLLTAKRVRHLRKGNSILRRASASPTTNSAAASNGLHCLPQQHMQMVLLYAKLLLTSGIAELSLETVVWTLGRTTIHIKMLYVRTEGQYLYASASTFLDFFRSLLVFWMSIGRTKRMNVAFTRLKHAWDQSAWKWINQRCPRSQRRVGVETENSAPIPNVKITELQTKENKTD